MATIVGLAGLIGAVILIPVRWFVRIGGREPTWELRRARVEVAQMANRVRRNPTSVPAHRLREAIVHLQTIRTPDTAELCDLLVAELEDLLSGAESWNEAGRRSIRLDQLCRAIWPDDVPAPEFDPVEATFRWQLYRSFGRMIELGQADPTRTAVYAFEGLKDSLAVSRREETFRFIDAVQQSADRWLARPEKDRPWIESFEFRTLGPDGLAEIKQLWGREASLWGAELDEDDVRALAEDLARRSAARHPDRTTAAPVAAPAGPIDSPV